jgi:hypothetical protein
VLIHKGLNHKKWFEELVLCALSLEPHPLRIGGKRYQGSVSRCVLTGGPLLESNTLAPLHLLKNIGCKVSSLVAEMMLSIGI